MSTGIGSSFSALRCIKTPTGFCSLTALWAAMTERGRLSAIGSTVLGNSTMPRTGTMMRPSGGNGGEFAPPWLSSEWASAGASAILSLRLVQRNKQATVQRRSMDGVVAARGKTNTALEPALRKLEAVDGRGLDLLGIGANPG